VISEDRIREWEAGRSSSALFCLAANSVAQILALNFMAFHAISNRNLTMRRASASRASAPWRTTRGICSAFSSSGLPTNLSGNNSQFLPPNLPQIRKWSRPLLTGSALQTEFGLTYRKQTTEKFLTGARTRISETRIRAKMTAESTEKMIEETNEEMSAGISKMKAIR
jgi:hypothetical protein